MPYSVTEQDILSVPADAAVICIENCMEVSEDTPSQRLAEAGGEAFLSALRERRFLSVGRACAVSPCALPFRSVFATGAPQWRMGEACELVVLRLCYSALYALAREHGCRSIAMPFLSAAYYRFPQEEAVRIGLEEAGRANIETIFLAQTPELFRLSRKSYPKPKIVSYVGYYRDHAVFALDNGQYARVDLRPERRDVNIRPYVEPCYYNEADPSLPPLSEAEVSRLRRIYESEWDLH